MKTGAGKECASCQHLLDVFIKLDASQGIEKLHNFYNYDLLTLVDP